MLYYRFICPASAFERSFCENIFLLLFRISCLELANEVQYCRHVAKRDPDTPKLGNSQNINVQKFYQFSQR